MEKMMIVNGSPRAPKSNSKAYIELFKLFWPSETGEYNVTSKKHHEACQKIEGCQHLLLVFPLYADGIPVTLMRFLQELHSHSFQQKPAIHVGINCGFIEPGQTSVAVDMIRLFCKQNHFPYGMTLCIGSGEAILNTPFVFLVKRKMKRMAHAIQEKRSEVLKVTMPLPKKVFVKASTSYWIGYAKKYNVTPDQMAVMEIESYSGSSSNRGR